MGKLIFVTGGAGSGKSIFAENLSKSFGESIYYIATLKNLDNEMDYKIKNHIARRDSSFTTIEAYKNFDKIFHEFCTENTILFDCLTNMITNLIFEKNIEWDNISKETLEYFEKYIETELNKLILSIKNHKGTTIIVSNELGMGLVPTYSLGRHFRNIAGKANQILAKESDEAYFIVSGIPMKIR